METLSIDHGLCKGDVCNRYGCKGVIDEHYTETSCSCHINPPCSHCTTDRAYCTVCGWECTDDEIETVIDKEQQERNRIYYEKQMKEWTDTTNLFYKRYHGKEPIPKLEMRTEGHTHFTQKVFGVFPAGTETRASILPKVVGTFGGRFNRFDTYSFEYIAYTD